LLFSNLRKVFQPVKFREQMLPKSRNNPSPYDSVYQLYITSKQLNFFRFTHPKLPNAYSGTVYLQFQRFYCTVLVFFKVKILLVYKNIGPLFEMILIRSFNTVHQCVQQVHDTSLLGHEVKSLVDLLSRKGITPLNTGILFSRLWKSQTFSKFSVEKHTTYNKFKSLPVTLFYKESRPRGMVIVFLEVKIL